MAISALSVLCYGSCEIEQTAHPVLHLRANGGNAWEKESVKQKEGKRQRQGKGRARKRGSHSNINKLRTMRSRI